MNCEIKYFILKLIYLYWIINDNYKSRHIHSKVYIGWWFFSIFIWVHVNTLLTVSVSRNGFPDSDFNSFAYYFERLFSLVKLAKLDCKIIDVLLFIKEHVNSLLLIIDPISKCPLFAIINPRGDTKELADVLCINV